MAGDKSDEMAESGVSAASVFSHAPIPLSPEHYIAAILFRIEKQIQRCLNISEHWTH